MITPLFATDLFSTDLFTITAGAGPDTLWAYALAATGETFAFAPPVFEMDGAPFTAAVSKLAEVAEHVYRGACVDDPTVTLTVTWRVTLGSPIVRFRYELASAAGRRLTRAGGADHLIYLQTSFAGLPSVTEVRLAEFNEQVHSYCLSERELGQAQFAQNLTATGPILVGASGTHALVLAYEHGAAVPDDFVRFRLAPDRTVALEAVKGSYNDGQTADGYQTLWMHAGAVQGTEDDLAHLYRDFLLRGITPNAASRAPRLFYNTWNFQERNRWWYGNPYLESMRQDRIAAEIEVAHRMGVEVFVLDTGWYEKTGDWEVNRARFPDGLRSIREKLDAYGMTLGLWFGPTHAAVSSRMFQDHADCLMTHSGVVPAPHEVWETESSHDLCLVSRYWEGFSAELIRLARELGVRYFKWDAVGQYGCDAPGHFHGTSENAERERADSYAFQLPGYLARVTNRLCEAFPDAVVDFDITENGRAVGLGFLAAGKYFLINNGPYNHNYDLKPPADGNVNLFFFPGPARAWVCRTPLPYDKWVPSVLFLTHYLPDDPAPSQELNISSLVLGQNGLWGDLLRVSEEGVARIGAALTAYKQVRHDITRATLRRTGAVGGSPEVYEKLDPATGKGVVSVFASAPGTYTYLTHLTADAWVWAMPGVTVTPLEDGTARIDARFEVAGGKCAFFGAMAGA